MFLDDELLKIAKEADATTPEGLQKLNADLCKKCESYYKSKLYSNGIPHHSQIKAILDRTFNLWDSFVRMAKIDSDKTLNILAELFEKHSLKNQFLQNEEMKSIYKSLNGL